MRKFYFLVLLLGFCNFAHASEDIRLITVTGEGELSVVPDEVSMSLQVQSFDKNLESAKKSNDDAIRKALALIKESGVADKDVQTGFVNVWPEDRPVINPQTGMQVGAEKGYRIERNISLTLRDVKKFESLLGGALKSGVNRVYGIQFRTSREKKLKEEARALAVRDARDKATKIAAELGEQVSRVHSVQESAGQIWPVYAGERMAKMAMAADQGETVALGEIKVSSSVAASFELK